MCTPGFLWDCATRSFVVSVCFGDRCFPLIFFCFVHQFYLPIMITPLVSSNFSHIGGIVDHRYLNIIFITGLKSVTIILFNLLRYKYRYIKI